MHRRRYKICRDTDGNDLLRTDILYDAAEDENRWKRYDLRHQKRQEQPCAVQSERLSVGCRHIDDGVDAIDIKEKCQQENKDMFLFYKLRKSPPQTFKTVSYDMVARF